MNDANGSTRATEAQVPLGAPSARGLSTEEWLAQSAIVAAVLGGAVLLVYGWKRMVLARAGGAQHLGTRAGTLSAGATTSVPAANDVHARVMALTDAVRVLRDEVARANGDVSVLREELDALRATLTQATHDGTLADGHSTHHHDHDARYEAARVRRAPHEDLRGAPLDAREAAPADGRDRVVALARRGMTPIAIARETGIPTGQVELILNLHRTGGA
jgi:hypothetical protein